MQIGAVTMENGMEVPQKIKKYYMIQKLYFWVLNQRKTVTQKDICKPTFNTVLFTTAKIWKQPNCRLMNEWIKKLWYTHNGILFGHKNETLPFATTHMDFKGLTLSVNQRKTNTYDLTYLWNLRQTHKRKQKNQTKLTDTENRLVAGCWECVKNR